MKAILFPGQGSQKVGMAKEHVESDKQFEERFTEADEILGYSLSDIMFNGPMEKLTETRYTQPAIFLHSVALFKKLKPEVDVTAGHSLGEFSALTAAGVIPFAQALELVSLRGELMQKAGATNPGTMAAIIGMKDEDVDEICRDATKEVSEPVVPANYNCDGQLVISGDVKAVKRAVELAKLKGCRLAKMLSVSGAFHSPLMQPAYDGLKEKLEEITFSDSKFPVYSNYTAEPTTDGATLKRNVLEQLLNPVRWTQTLINMGESGVTHYTEMGPGKVLQGLVKRTHRKAEIDGYE